MEITQPNIQDEKTQDAVAEVAQPATSDKDSRCAQPAIAKPSPSPKSSLRSQRSWLRMSSSKGARAKLNSALGSIDGSDLAISKAEDQVILLESEMETAQVNVSFARQEALGFRQSLHDACDDTQSAIRLIRAKYPLA